MCLGCFIKQIVRSDIAVKVKEKWEGCAEGFTDGFVNTFVQDFVEYFVCRSVRLRRYIQIISQIDTTIHRQLVNN